MYIQYTDNVFICLREVYLLHDNVNDELVIGFYVRYASEQGQTSHYIGCIYIVYCKTNAARLGLCVYKNVTMTQHVICVTQ